MSSQSLNTSGITGAVNPYGYPTRDSSDYTSAKRRRIEYIELYGNTGYYPYGQSNDLRIDYSFGHVGCTGATVGCTFFSLKTRGS